MDTDDNVDNFCIDIPRGDATLKNLAFKKSVLHDKVVLNCIPYETIKLYFCLYGFFFETIGKCGI